MTELEYLNKRVGILEYALSNLVSSLQNSGNVANEVGYNVQQELASLAEEYSKGGDK